ncbi:MAG: NapC/NirT family cytochrome c [Nitrospinae bacterium]|nr:NapC/NirT family cytochrome c [Nitrospinota bacterium]
MKFVLIFFAVFNVVFLIILIQFWSHFSTKTKKIIAFFCLGLFPVFWGIGVAQQNLKETTAVGFCNNCHIMEPYVESLKFNYENSLDVPLASIHYQNNWVSQKVACYECHTRYTMFGTFQAKLTGLKHLWKNYFTQPPEKLELYKPFSPMECLRCHGTSKKFLTEIKHNKDSDLITALKQEKRTCLEEGCHEVAHILKDKKDF